VEIHSEKACPGCDQVNSKAKEWQQMAIVKVTQLMAAAGP
jgi:RNA polymerase subunit RPABC4/transcription elongation factor Spt4